MKGVFDGVAILRESELEVEIVRGAIAVTRINDKQLDDLHLAIEVSGHPPGPQYWAPIATSPTVVLHPTVDSAGPQLTTWQSADTLRVLMPWTASPAPRWLLFKLGYRTVSYSGRRWECDGTLGTDTLRFVARSP